MPALSEAASRPAVALLYQYARFRTTYYEAAQFWATYYDAACRPVVSLLYQYDTHYLHYEGGRVLRGGVSASSFGLRTTRRRVGQ